MRKRIKIGWSCSDKVKHEHKWRMTAWLCGRMQYFWYLVSRNRKVEALNSVSLTYGMTCCSECGIIGQGGGKDMNKIKVYAMNRGRVSLCAQCMISLRLRESLDRNIGVKGEINDKIWVH